MLQNFNSPPPSPLLAQPPPADANADADAGPAHPRRALRLPDVANVIVRLRRARQKDPARAYPVTATSGPPHSHACLGGADAVSARRVPLDEAQRFLCKDGVDLKKLLRRMRAGLLERAEAMGATVLVDEQWTCTIHSPRRDGVYKVDIHYTACAARSSHPDPRQPIALEEAKGIPGLMTVIG